MPRVRLGLFAGLGWLAGLAVGTAPGNDPPPPAADVALTRYELGDRKSTRLNSSHRCISYAVFCLIKKKLTILSKTDALDEEKWLNMLGTFVKDWFRYESHFVHGRDSLVDILKERGLLSESDAVQPLIGKKS